MNIKSFLRLHDSEEQRVNSIFASLQEAKIPPSFVISCPDGIILAALTKSPKTNKILRIYDRIAFVGAGVLLHCENLYRFAAAQAKIRGYVHLSPGDFRIFEETVKELAGMMHTAFLNLFSNDYFRCQLVMAEVGFEQNEDKICNILPNGYYDIVSNSLVVIPDLQKTGVRIPAGQLQALESEQTMREAFGRLREICSHLDAELIANLTFEVAVLSREAAQQKGEGFKRVYQKLTPAEVAEWSK